jgi:hypothetical protein
MAGTCVFPLYCKAETHADNTTESKMDAAQTELEKVTAGYDYSWMI